MIGRLADRLRAEGTVTVVGVGEEDLGAGDVGEGRNAVIPEGGIHDGAGRVDHHPLEEGRADPLGDAALELSPRLHGVDDRAGVEGLHALQDADLAGDAMHGDAKTMGQKGRGTGRSVHLARHVEFVPKRCGLVELLQRERSIPAAHAARPRGDIVRRARRKPGWPGRADFPAMLRRPSGRRASPRWCPCWRRSPCRRASCPCRRSPWRRPPPASSARRRRPAAARSGCRCRIPRSPRPGGRSRRAAATGGTSERCSVGGAQSCPWMATPRPSSHSSPSGLGFAPAAREGLFDEIEALIQPVAADHAVVREGPDAVNGIVRPDHVRAPHRERVDPQLAAQLVDGATRWRTPVASRHIPGRRRTAPYSCRPRSRCPSCWGSGRWPSRSRATRPGPRRRGCRRPRCWRRCGSASR